MEDLFIITKKKVKIHIEDYYPLFVPFVDTFVSSRKKTTKQRSQTHYSSSTVRAQIQRKETSRSGVCPYAVRSFSISSLEKL